MSPSSLRCSRFCTPLSHRQAGLGREPEPEPEALSSRWLRNPSSRTEPSRAKTPRPSQKARLPFAVVSRAPLSCASPCAASAHTPHCHEQGQAILCLELEPKLLPPFTLSPGLAPLTKPSPSAPSLELHPLRACPLRVCIPPFPMDRVKSSLTMCYPRCACFSPYWVKSRPRDLIHVHVPP
ncbi:hypothetical protein AMTR_s00052p00224880 [Amborella trichopoda]|uniref:Uncharacterized protein n=1 Tax=Amborella trichopoda TaxID=13333 RepID=U5D4Y3_AMBTC|nr:hypothetical protein AMTR_s00052p00224880 [Amborella trichopoda]